MGETKFKKLKLELAVMQSHMSVFDEDRPRALRAMNGLGIADEMYEMLEFLVNNDSINDHSINKEVQTLLAKARGEHD